MADQFAKLSDLEQQIIMDIIPQVSHGEQMTDQVLTPQSDGTEETYEIRFNAAERRYLRMKGLVSATLERMKTVQAENNSLKLAAIPAEHAMEHNTPSETPALQYTEAVARMKVYQNSIQAVELLYAKDKSMRDDLFDYEEHRHESNDIISALSRMLKIPPPNFKCPGCKEKINRMEQMAKGSGMIQVLAADRRAFVFGYYAHRVEPVERKLGEMEEQMAQMNITIKKFEQTTNQSRASVDQHELNVAKGQIIAAEKELKSWKEKNARMANEIQAKGIKVKTLQYTLDDLTQKIDRAEARFQSAKKSEEEIAKKYSAFDAEEVYARLHELRHKAETAEAEKSLLEYRVRTAKAAIDATTKKLAEMQMGSLSINDPQ